MAYLICPDCMMPNAVSDDVAAYACYSCAARVVFDRCPDCGFTQSIPARWQTAFACGSCGERVEIPRRRSYATSTTARSVEGYGYMYPRP